MTHPQATAIAWLRRQRRTRRELPEPEGKVDSGSDAQRQRPPQARIDLHQRERAVPAPLELHHGDTVPLERIEHAPRGGEHTLGRLDGAAVGAGAAGERPLVQTLVCEVPEQLAVAVEDLDADAPA